MALKHWARGLFGGLVAIGFLSVSVCAASVGDVLSFEAGNITESTPSGDRVTGTRTEAQRAADAQNLQSLNEFTELGTQYVLSQIPIDRTIEVPWEEIEESEETIDPEYLKEFLRYADRYIMAQSLDTPKEVLESIGGYADNFNSAGYNYRIPNYAAWQSALSGLSDAEYAELMRIAYNKGFGNIRDKEEVTEFSWDSLDPEEKEKIKHFLELLLKTENGGTIVRQTITGGKDIIDFRTYEERLKALNAYLTTFALDETVKTTYIVEVKAESTTRATLRRSVPKTWGTTGATHYWLFECLEAADGAYHPAVSVFSGPSVSKMFQYAGKYRVSATQILEQTYYDALTYTINEYWVIEDTGQVIYKKESTGSKIDSESGVPMADQNLIHVSYYNHVNDGTFYVTVLDQEVTITHNSFSGSFDAAGVLDWQFNTKRVE